MIAKVEIAQKLIVTKSLTVIGSIGGTGDFPRAMEFLCKNPASADKLISHYYPIGEAAQAFATARVPEDDESGVDAVSGTKRLGWIGTGAMGGPMAARLCKAGYPVTICGSGRRDLSGYAMETGARLAHNPREVAEQADIIFTMIPNGEVLLDVITGPDGLDKASLQEKK